MFFCFFSILAVVTSPSGNDKHTGHTARRPDSVPGDPRSPLSFIEIDDTDVHGAVSFTGVTSVSKNKKQKTKHKTYNSSPQNTQQSACPYEGRTPKSNWSRMWALLLLLSYHACTFTSGSVKAWRGKGSWKLSAAAEPADLCLSHLTPLRTYSQRTGTLIHDVLTGLAGEVKPWR